MPVAVLVPGYGGRVRGVERWRMAVALRTVAVHGGGRLVVSGHGGEAERLAALAPDGADVVLESTARSTLENLERTLPLLREAEQLAVATDRFHRARVVRYSASLEPDLLARLVEPVYGWRRGWWMDAGGPCTSCCCERGEGAHGATAHARPTDERAGKAEELELGPDEAGASCAPCSTA